MIKVIFRNTISKIIGLISSAVFTIIAPKYVFPNSYENYVLYLKIISAFNLILLFGSAGVISRFVPEIKNNFQSLLALVKRSLIKKGHLSIFILCILFFYGVYKNEYHLLILFILAIFISFLEFFVTLFYSLEKYHLKIYNKLIYQFFRLVCIPIGRANTILFLVITELFSFTLPVISLAKSISFKKLLYFTHFTNSKSLFKIINQKDYRKIELNTYISSFLFFFLNAFPILIANYLKIEDIRDISIYFVITNTLIFNLINSVNEVILPTLIKKRKETKSIRSFYRLSIFIPASLGGIVTLMFYFSHEIINEFYKISNNEYFYFFMIYSVCSAIINSIRQLYFIYDKMMTFNIGLMIYYVVCALIILISLQHSKLQIICILFLILTIIQIFRFNKLLNKINE